VDITIQACTEDDIGTLREIALETFRETFGRMNTVEDETLVGYLKTNVGAAQSDAVDPHIMKKVVRE